MNIYNRTRAYYAYIVRKEKKENCVIALMYHSYENVHTIMDALFFDGAQIIDCKENEYDEWDGKIDCDSLTFYGAENIDLDSIVEYEHHNNATCTKYKREDE